MEIWAWKKLINNLTLGLDVDTLEMELPATRPDPRHNSTGNGISIPVPFFVLLWALLLLPDTTALPSSSSITFLILKGDQVSRFLGVLFHGSENTEIRGKKRQREVAIAFVFAGEQSETRLLQPLPPLPHTSLCSLAVALEEEASPTQPPLTQQGKQVRRAGPVDNWSSRAGFRLVGAGGRMLGTHHQFATFPSPRLSRCFSPSHRRASSACNLFTAISPTYSANRNSNQERMTGGNSIDCSVFKWQWLESMRCNFIFVKMTISDPEVVTLWMGGFLGIT